MQYYFIGIKGTGMSALANILADLGHEVKGADYDKKFFTEATLRESIIVEKFENCILSKEYFYIIGNAFKVSDITKKIISSGYNYLFYSNFLEEYFKMKKIGISGSHGKTTTTFFTSQLISKKINALIGDGTGVGNFDSEYFLLEACEYQNHFLNYTYEYLVILNIDYDHPDFFKTNNEYVYAFFKAALNASVIIVNYDDLNCRKIVHKNKITFGFNPNADIVLKQKENLLVVKIDDIEYEMELNFYGKHMTYDLAAAFIVCYLIGEEPEVIINKIPLLKLPARRFFEKKMQNDIILVNDYAHHPTEIAAIINSIRLKYPKHKLCVVYQGHTYSRTNTFLYDYVSALNAADSVYIMPTFSSVREMEEDEYSLLKASKEFKKYSREDIESLFWGENMVVAFLGAGDIDNEFIFLIKKVNY